MTGQMAGVLCVQHVLLSMAFGSIYWLPAGAIRTPECQEIDADGAGGNFRTAIENPPMVCYIKFREFQKPRQKWLKVIIMRMSRFLKSTERMSFWAFFFLQP